MTTWSILLIASSLVTADAGARKADGATPPAPATSTRIKGITSRTIVQAGYMDGGACSAPANNCCAPAAAVGCAAPSACAPAAPVGCAAPSSCAPEACVPACSQPVTCCQPATCYQPMDCGHVVGCGAPMNCAGAITCGGMNGCGCGYGNSCECCEEQGCCKRCCNKCRWGRAHTTGDMYPHFAYYPQDHGYYYFRPYNYMHVYEQRARVVSMGGDPRNPYSVAMFDPIYEEFNQNVQPLPPLPGTVHPLGSQLPMLEDLLQN